MHWVQVFGSAGELIGESLRVINHGNAIWISGVYAEVAHYRSLDGTDVLITNPVEFSFGSRERPLLLHRDEAINLDSPFGKPVDLSSRPQILLAVIEYRTDLTGEPRRFKGVVRFPEPFDGYPKSDSG